MTRWVAGAGSHRGKVRETNEDWYHLDEERGIFIVADGMGGHAAGEVASRIAADTALEALRRAGSASADTLRATFQEARDRIAECCADRPETRGMGTTLTAALLDRTGQLRIGHIGDSRLYRLRGGELHQLTRDHSWVQQEVDAGRLRPEEAPHHPFSHVLNRVLTATDPSAPDVITTRAEPGDLLLLCTDGLYNMIDGQPLIDVLARDGHDPNTIVDGLVAAANRRGGADNITAIVVRISE